MTREVQLGHAGDTVQQAARAMAAANVGFLPVCQGDGTVVGVLTDRDLVVRVLADGGAADTPVEAVMTEDVVSCRPTDSLHRAEELMRTNQKNRLVCVDDDGRLEGVISMSDIVQYEHPARAGILYSDVTERGVSPHRPVPAHPHAGGKP